VESKSNVKFLKIIKRRFSMAKKKTVDTSFEDWIKTTKISKIKEMLKVCDSTISHWLSGHTLPRTHQMRKIKKLTKGKVGYDQIIEGSCSPFTR
jgi:hypothetical protein